MLYRLVSSWMALAILPAVLHARQPGRNVIGYWSGALPLEIPFRVGLRFEMQQDSLVAYADFPDQNARGLRMSSVRIRGDSILTALAAANIRIDGVLAGKDSIAARFSQGAQVFAFMLRRGAAAAPKRPQEPVPPFAYAEHDVRIPNGDVTLAGTFTVPTEPLRGAVLLLQGAGPMDRDATVAGHRPFVVLADFLARAGYAVLRYDKRGVGASSGQLAAATLPDLATDAAAAVAYLRNRLAGTRLIVVGHSEGALIAAMMAEPTRPHLSVLLAPAAVRGDSLMLQRARAHFRARGVPDSIIAKDARLRSSIFDAIVAATDSAEVSKAVHLAVSSSLDAMTATDLSALGYSRADWLQSGAAVFVDQWRWFGHWLRFDPIEAYSRMHGRVLAVYGSKDQQVPPPMNADRLRRVLEARGDGSLVVVLSGLNHLMQNATSGSPAEYTTIEETLAPALFDLIQTHLKSQGR